MNKPLSILLMLRFPYFYNFPFYVRTQKTQQDFITLQYTAIKLFRETFLFSI